MTRKGELRDAIATALAAKLTGFLPIEAVVAPIYKPEDLFEAEGETTGPRCPVWLAGTTPETPQGPAWNVTTVAVGVIGTTFDAEGYSLSDESVRIQELKAADRLDGYLETVQRLFTPDLDSDLHRLETASTAFRFQNLTQPLILDTALYRENGVWLSALFLEYLDEFDDDEE